MSIPSVITILEGTASHTLTADFANVAEFTNQGSRDNFLVLGRMTAKTETFNAQSLGNVAGDLVIDVTNGQYISMTVTGSISSLSFLGLPPAGQTFVVIMKITSGSIGGAWNFGPQFKFTGGNLPIFSTGLDKLSLDTDDGGATFTQMGFISDIK